MSMWRQSIRLKSRTIKLIGVALLGFDPGLGMASEWNGSSGDWYESGLWIDGEVPGGNGTSVLLNGSLLAAPQTVNYQPLWSSAEQFNPLYQQITLSGASTENLLTVVQASDPWGDNNQGAGPTALRSSQIHIGLFSLYDLQGGSLEGDLSVVGSLLIKPTAMVGGDVTVTGGSVVQTGGTADYGQMTIVAPSAHPSYDLSAGSVETEQFLLYTGRLKQTGGDLTVTGDMFVLGFSFTETSQSAILELGGNGHFTSAAEVQIGGATVAASIQQGGGFFTAHAGTSVAANGTYVQSGGMSASDSLRVTGLYSLSGGTLETESFLAVAGDGIQTGVFSQTAGTATVGTDLEVRGRVALAGGILNVTGTTQIDAPTAAGYEGFHQTGGSHVLGGNLEVIRGKYSLSGSSSTLSMFGSLIVGGTTANPLFEMTAGSVAVGQHVLVGGIEGSEGRMIASGGSLQAVAANGTVRVGAGDGEGGVGALTFNGDNEWTVSEVWIGSQRGLGTLTVTAGASTIDGDLFLGRVENSLMDSPEGYAAVTGGSLEVHNLWVGSSLAGNASVSHSGGTVTVNNTLTLGQTYGLSGTGSLATGETLVSDGATFTQNTDSLGYKHSTGNLEIQAGGEYQLAGGETLVSETTSLSGTFTQSGGRLTTTNLILQGHSEFTVTDGNVVILDEWRRGAAAGDATFTQHGGALSALSAALGGNGTTGVNFHGGTASIFGALHLDAGATVTVDNATLGARELTLIGGASFDATDEAILVGSLAGSGVKIGESISLGHSEVKGGSLSVGAGGDVYLGLGSTMVIAGRTTLSGSGVLGIHGSTAFQTGQLTFSPSNLDWSSGRIELTNSALRIATVAGGTEDSFWGSTLSLTSSQGLKVSHAVNVYSNSSLVLSAGVLESGSVAVASGGSFSLGGSAILRTGSFSFDHASGRTFELGGGSLQTTGDVLYFGGSPLVGTITGGSHTIGGNFEIRDAYSDIRQSGGSLTVNNELRIGAGVGDDSSSFRLATGSTLNTGKTILGYQAMSSFFHAGGSHSGETLQLGHGGTGSGTYAITLAGGGTVDFSSIELWSGAFSQSAGSVEADTLSIGTSTGITARTGTYRLRGGTLDVGTLTIAGGAAATGVLEQTDGVLTISENLHIQKTSGSFILSNGSVEAGAIINRGTLAFDPGSGSTARLVDAPITNHHHLIVAADTTLIGSGLILENEATGTITLQNHAHLGSGFGASLHNLGTITGSGSLGHLGTVLLNDGLIAPGNSPGTIHFSGEFTQSSAGSLALEIGGLTPGSEFDQFILTDGIHVFEGTLFISFINGFVAEAGQYFDLIESSNATYLFDAIEVNGLAPDLQWTISEIGDFYSFEIHAVPEPSAALLLVVGLFAVGFFQRPHRLKNR